MKEQLRKHFRKKKNEKIGKNIENKKEIRRRIYKTLMNEEKKRK